MKRALSMAGALLVLIVIGVGIFLLRHQIAHIWRNTFNTFEVRVRAGSPTETLYQLDRSRTLHAVDSIVDGVVEDSLSGTYGTVQIVRTPEGAFDVFRKKDTVMPVSSDGTRKEFLAVSTDGMYVAYAELIDTNPEKVDLLESWQVVLVDVANNIRTPLSIGYAPQFVATAQGARLFFTAPSGLALANPVTLETMTVRLSLSSLVHSYALMSSDGALIAVPNTSLYGYTLYGVTQLEPAIGIEPLSVINAPVASLVFAQGYAIGTVAIPSATQVHRYDVQDTSIDDVVTTLPETTALYRLMP